MDNTGISRRLLAVALAVALAVTTAPTAALAEMRDSVFALAAASEEGFAEAETDEAGEELVDDASDEESAGDESEGDDGTDGEADDVTVDGTSDDEFPEDGSDDEAEAEADDEADTEPGDDGVPADEADDDGVPADEVDDGADAGTDDEADPEVVVDEDQADEPEGPEEPADEEAPADEAEPEPGTKNAPDDEDDELFTMSLASGTWGTCGWEITDEGVLTIHAGNGTDIPSSGAPWSAQNTSITAVSFPDGKGSVKLPASSRRLFAGCSALTEIDLTGLDTSDATNMSYMFLNCSSLQALDLSSFVMRNVTSMSFMFSGCSSLKSLRFKGSGISTFDTSNVTNMSYLFQGCSALESLSLTPLTTANVTNMSYMFDGCSMLTSVTLSSFNTANVTNMACMFQDCSSLKSLNVSRFDTSKVTNFASMFANCSSLESLDLSSMNTLAAINMNGMFNGCSKLESVRVGEEFSFKGGGTTALCQLPSVSINGHTDWLSADTGQWYSSVSIAASRSGIADTYSKYELLASGTWGTCAWELDHAGTLTIHAGTGKDTTASGGKPWSGYLAQITAISTPDAGMVVLPETSRELFSGCSSLTSLDFSSFDASGVTNMTAMLSGCSSLETLDLSLLDTSNVNSMNDLFSGCSSLMSLNLSSLDTTSVTGMSNMFSGCSSLESLDLSSFDTSAVITMGSMFYGCSSLTSLDLSGFDTTGVTTMGSMFYQCSALASLHLSPSFKTSKVTGMANMFSGCKSLTSLDLSSFSTANVSSMQSMFRDCSSLTSLDLTSFVTTKVSNLRYMFQRCTSLASLDLSSFDTTKVTAVQRGDMFDACKALAMVKVGQRFSFGSGSYRCTLPSYEINGHTDWWSLEAGEWFTADEIATSRSNIADTYYKDPFIVSGLWGTCAWEIDRGGTLTIHAGTGADIESYYDCPWYSYRTFIKTFSTPDAGKVVLPQKSTHLFYGCTVLASLDLSSFDTSNVTSMASMFSNCDALESVNLTSFDTSNVTDMGDMFWACKTLKSVDLSSFETSSVTSMSHMFYSCSSLSSLDLSSFDSSSLNNMYDMFGDCSSLASLDLSSFDTSNVVWMDGLFYNCSSLASLDLSSFDTSKVRDVWGWGGGTGMFDGCTSLASVKVGSKFAYECDGTTDCPLPAYAVNGHEDWWSLGTGAWYTAEQIKASRSKVADTYVKAVPPISQVTISSVANQTYTGSAIKPTPTVKMGSLKLTKGTDYELSYSSNVNVGTAKITVTGKGNYAGTKSVSFKIVRAAVAVPKAKTGLTYTGSALTGVASGTGYTLSGTYRAINAGSYVAKATPDANHKWSDGTTTTKSISWSIARASVASATVAAVENQTYTGSAIKPTPVVKLGGKTLTKDTDYTLSYKNNVNVGNATITVTGKGNLTGTRSVTFKVVAANVGKATVSAIADQVYSDSPKRPTPTVKMGTKTLTKGTDYTLSYKDNVNVGIAFVTVKGIGNYTGTRSVTFRIAFKDVPKSHQFYEKIHLAVEEGLIAGYSGEKVGTFGPSDNITRGQIAVILWRMAGQPAPGASAKTFPDVKSTAFYYKAVSWASSVGVVNGYANGTFGPEDNITREQLAVMIANYASKMGGIKVSGSASDYAGVSDKDSVSAYARSSVGWCYKKGIFVLQSGKLNPTKTADRATAAQMAYDLYQLIG